MRPSGGHLRLPRAPGLARAGRGRQSARLAQRTWYCEVRAVPCSLPSVLPDSGHGWGTWPAELAAALRPCAAHLAGAALGGILHEQRVDRGAAGVGGELHRPDSCQMRLFLMLWLPRAVPHCGLSSSGPWCPGSAWGCWPWVASPRGGLAASWPARPGGSVSLLLHPWRLLESLSLVLEAKVAFLLWFLELGPPLTGAGHGGHCGSQGLPCAGGLGPAGQIS